MMKRILLALMFTLIPLVGSAQDSFDLSQAAIVNSPDVRGWPVTTSITAVSFDGTTTRVTFTKQDGPNRWPDATLPGWEGPLQYTLWLFRKVNNQWVGSGFVQFWHGRDGSGSPQDPDVPSLYDRHWYYDQRWAPLYGSGQIQPGEVIGFMVTAGGGARNNTQVSLQERSNVVTFPAQDKAIYVFSAPTTNPTPAPSPIPPVVVNPPVTPSPSAPPSDLVGQVMALGTKLAMIEAELNLVDQDVNKGRDENKQAFNQVASVWKQIGEPLLKYVAPALGAAIATWQVTKK